jgi:hypothetical protein
LINQQPGDIQMSPFGRPMQWDRVTATLARHDVGAGVEQRLHNLQETSVRGAMEWSSSDVGVSSVNLRGIGLENPANQGYIAAAGGRDQIVTCTHHCLLEDDVL